MEGKKSGIADDTKRLGLDKRVERKVTGDFEREKGSEVDWMGSLQIISAKNDELCNLRRA